MVRVDADGFGFLESVVDAERKDRTWKKLRAKTAQEANPRRLDEGSMWVSILLNADGARRFTLFIALESGNNDWNTKHSSAPDLTDDYILRAADGITEFLADHPQYELVNIETRPSGLRLWYTYPIDENGREIC